MGKREDIIKEIDEVFEECSEENWDGYDAHPVTKDHVEKALKFLSIIPDKYLTREGLDFSASPDPDGAISFDWYFEPFVVVSVSVESGGELHCAGLSGKKSFSSTEYNSGEFPEIVTAWLEMLFNESSH